MVKKSFVQSELETQDSGSNRSQLALYACEVIVVLFVSLWLLPYRVYIHEFGHAFAALILGWRVEKISLGLEWYVNVSPVGRPVDLLELEYSVIVLGGVTAEVIFGFTLTLLSALVPKRKLTLNRYRVLSIAFIVLGLVYLMYPFYGYFYCLHAYQSLNLRALPGDYYWLTFKVPLFPVIYYEIALLTGVSITYACYTASKKTIDGIYNATICNRKKIEG